MNRLDKFIELLIEGLQPHGGCQCGCANKVLGAVEEARSKLEEFDAASDQMEQDAYNSVFDNYGSQGE